MDFGSVSERGSEHPPLSKMSKSISARDITNDTCWWKRETCQVSSWPPLRPIFYMSVCKLPHTLIFQDLHVLFTSNLDQSFIIRKENDLHHLRFDSFCDINVFRSAKYMSIIRPIQNGGNQLLFLRGASVQIWSQYHL